MKTCECSYQNKIMSAFKIINEKREAAIEIPGMLW